MHQGDLRAPAAVAAEAAVKPLQLYRVAFSHAAPLHLMARDLAHAITSGKELCPDAQFLSATLMPEWDNTDETRCLAAQPAPVH